MAGWKSETGVFREHEATFALNSRNTLPELHIATCRWPVEWEVRAALQQCFDLLGGIGGLVKDKTVTVKINLTGTNFLPLFNRPVGESYMTHPATALALGALLFDAGARRVRFVESNLSRANMETTLALADWDVNELALRRPGRQREGHRRPRSAGVLEDRLAGFQAG